MHTASFILRETLVGVLGLNLVAPPRPVDTPAPASPIPELPPPSPFLPGIFVLGNHHLLEGVMKDAEATAAATDPAQTAAFDAWSAKLAKGDEGDLVPMLAGLDQKLQDPNLYWNSPETQELLWHLVKPRSPDAPPAPHAGKDRVGE